MQANLLLRAGALFAACAAAAAQDECLSAISVNNGPNGPYTNAGMTTSAPAWGCGLGGNDIWFSYVALGTGTVTADTCGGSYDSTIEAFDGSGGCGALLSLGCNDDSCSLQSSITFACTAGVTYYIRVGGFNSSTGTFPLNINGPAGTGTVASVTPYGTGCYTGSASFYELFAPASAFDLNGTSLTMLYNGSGYTVLPGISPWIAPGANAIALALGDDNEVSQALAFPFLAAGGPYSSMQVCSNGFVSLGGSNGTAYVPNVSSLLNNGNTGFYCWHDFNAGATGSGQIKFEQVGAVAVVTWDGVYDYGGTSAANANTFQMQFDCASGNVTMAWQTMSALGGTTNTGILVGYSPGGASNNLGARDLSVAIPTVFNLPATDISPLTLGTSGRPRIGTSFNFVTTNVPAGTLVGATMLSFAQINPGLDLGFLGAPGCSQYLNPAVTLVSVLTTPGTFSQPFSIPNGASYIGLNLMSQSASFTSSANSAGVLTSNGVALRVGNL